MTPGLTLGFDTSGPYCAAALALDGRIVAAVSEDMAKGQAERLFPLLEELLAGAGTGWRGIAALGVGVGPGNFTGVRIAVSAARGLALSLRVPAEGVTGFEALAFGLPRPVLASLDARQGRLWLQVLRESGGDAPLLLGEGAALPPSMAGLIVAGHRAAALAARTGGRALSPALPPAWAIALIAAARAAAGRPRPAPLYLRPPDAVPAAPQPRIVP
ncbi:MAG: tRNA (adenosine(37)-N6)-threonylcarbamoyltransferase complex dimerization subunit type 1 TsaB [Paracoccaceae bacterium]